MGTKLDISIRGGFMSPGSPVLMTPTVCVGHFEDTIVNQFYTHYNGWKVRSKWSHFGNASDSPWWSLTFTHVATGVKTHEAHDLGLSALLMGIMMAVFEAGVRITHSLSPHTFFRARLSCNLIWCQRCSAGLVISHNEWISNHLIESLIPHDSELSQITMNTFTAWIDFYNHMEIQYVRQKMFNPNMQRKQCKIMTG